MAYLVDEDPITSALMSPGMAMAAQAAQNLTNMRMGGQVRSPIDAYQQAVYQRARLDQQRQNLLQQQQLRDLQMQRQQQLIDNPAAAQGKTIDQRNLATYRELLEKANQSGDPLDREMAERFAFSANLNTQGRDSANLTSTDSQRLSEANSLARQHSRQANRLDNLAQQFAVSDIDSGVAGQAEDWFKRFTGNEDWESELRREQREIINSDVINNLPPGVASDRDIAIAREGYPTSFADKDYVASYFRGLAKIRRLDAEYEAFVADYVSREGNQRGMNSAWENHIESKYVGEAEGDAAEGWSIRRN